jgi:NAD(P)-dependent dehydrogenase (short-subunit alcohol dehydrogenase family)
MATFTQVVHTSPYPAISPSVPALSQIGKTVLITGGSAGIGYAIARAFAQASASRIIICGRRPELVTSAASKLINETPGFQGRVIGRTCDVADLFSVNTLWTGLQKENIFVDVLVLNAARMQAKGPLLETELEEVWSDFLTNVRANLDFSQRFHNQNGPSENGHKKVCFHI